MVNLGGIVGGGASVAITIYAVDKFSNVFKGAETSLGKFGSVAAGALKGVTVVAAATTTALVGIGATSVKAASDFEETNAKFGTVFQDISDGAEKVAQDLRKNYGLSEVASKRLLSNTGDLLTGFNFTGDAALGISEKVNKLAVDLASFTNASGGAEAVSSALTKALLGERESLKTYGIAILDADVKARVLENGMGNLTGEAMRQAKAQATLELAMEQSKNAIGDFGRTQDSFANQTRIMQAGIEDLKVSIGSNLLPVITPVVSKLSEFIGSIDPEQVTKIVDSITGLLVPVFETIGSVIGENLPAIKEFFINTMERGKEAWDIIKPAVEVLGKAFGKFIAAVLPPAKEFFGKVLETGRELWEGISDFIQRNEPLISKAFENIGKIVGALFDALGWVWGVLVDWWKWLDGVGFFDAILYGFTALTEGVVITIGAIKKIPGVLARVWDRFKSFGSIVGSQIKLIGIGFEFLWEGIKIGAKSAVNFVIGSVENLINIMIRGLNTLIRGAIAVANKVPGVNFNASKYTIGEVAFGRLDTGVNTDRISELGQEAATEMNNITVNIENLTGLNIDEIADALQERLEVIS